MPLDATRRDPEPEPDRTDELTRRVLADPAFQQCALELLEQALIEVGGSHPCTPEMFERLCQQPRFRHRLQAVASAVMAEQRRGWSA